jgi:hypothetical protein
MGFQQIVPPSTYFTTGPDFARIAQWLRHFDPDFYRAHPHIGDRSDLADLEGESLYRHFIETGWKERRLYSRFIDSFLDPGYYQDRYPELHLPTEAAARCHWMYEGFYEGRVPNGVTQMIFDSDIHLFQFGKVGSKAIQRALEVAGHDRHVMHLHWPSDLITTYPDCPLSYEELLRRSPRDRIRFICGVRDPFERIIAGYFETAAARDQQALLRTTVRDIARDIEDEFFRRDWVEVILKWFEHKFFRHVDVYRQPFDIASGFSVMSGEAAEVFVYRFDALPRLEGRLSEFVDRELQLDVVNASSDKPYGGLYREALDAVRFERRDVERVTDAQFTRHFFDAREIDRMQKRWSKPLRRRFRLSGNAVSAS